MAAETARGKLTELSFGQKYGIIFGGSLALAAIIIATVVFPFWNLIREDVFEEVEILKNDNRTCYVETSDDIPKTIKNCNLTTGEVVNIRYGHGLAWAEIVP